MKNPFRHRQQIRKHEKGHKVTNEVKNHVSIKNLRVGAGAPDAGRFAEVPTKNVWSQVVPTTYYPYDEGVSGKEENQMSKSYRLAMAQALLTELAEATARYGSDNEGVKRLHRMVRTMVAELLA